MHELGQRISYLEAQLQERDELILRLLARIEDLERNLAEKTVRKDSQNSSQPPSGDMKRPQGSLRKRSGRRSGGQPGHEGHRLEMRSPEELDEHVDLKPAYCEQCGAELAGSSMVSRGRRQQIDLPVIQPIVSEYEVYEGQCACCGHRTCATYPAGFDQPIQYGPRLAAFVGYASVRQYLPFGRLQEMLREVFDLKLSQGTIHNLLERLAKQAEPIYELIREEVEKATTVGSDETSAKVKGTKWWVWVCPASGISLSFITVSQSRGKQTIARYFPEGFLRATLCSDRWAAQLATAAKAYQICLAHLLRDCNYLEALEKTSWVKQIAALIEQAWQLKREQAAYNKNAPEAQEIETQLDQLLNQSLDSAKHPKTCTFQQALKKHRHRLLVFLYDADVPPDNNASERAIRNIRVKLKISGQFKSGQRAFCVLRSLIDTAIKKGNSPYEIMQLLAQAQWAE